MRALALLLTSFTGFSGLVYEVAWQKYLATLLGSHSEATAAVLGIFLGSLAAGYAIFGKVTRRLVSAGERAGRSPRLLLLYGAVEAAIGVYALAFPELFRGAQWLSVRLPAANDAMGFALDLGLSALLIAPPTVLMGGTIPILTQALARDLEDATRFHAFVYAFNTAGAFLGALAAGFWLVPWLGLVGVMRAMATVNLAAGAIFALGGRSERPGLAAAPAGGAPTEGFAALATVALLGGFATMALQTVLIRLGGLALGASQFTFSTVVAVFVLCIALGSFAVSALRRIPSAAVVVAQVLLVALMGALYLVLPDATYWAHRLRIGFGSEPGDFYPYYLSAFAWTLGVLLIPIGLSGATLPLLFHHLRRRFGDLGAVAGRLYSWNTVGSLLGALLGGYALLLWLDLHHVYRIALAALVAGAAILAVRVSGAPRWLAGVCAAGALAALAALPAWDPLQLSAGLFRVREAAEGSREGPAAAYAVLARRGELIFHDDDPSATVAVRERSLVPREPRRGLDLRRPREIIVNGKSDGDQLADFPTMSLAALVPAILADRHERSFVIGFGTGVTAGELAGLPDSREVIVAEISRAVLEAAPLFDAGNQGATRNPKIRLQRGDAYRALLRSEGRFDVIASEPSNPWVTGVEMLFSREFLEAARDRLAPGGVYAQWIHSYETNADVLELVFRTYLAVFDHVAVWYAHGPDILLLGMQGGDPTLDLARIEARFAEPAFAAAFERAGIESLPGLLSHELVPLGVLRPAALPGDVHTLLHPVLSHRAARAFFVGKAGHVPSFVSLEAERAASRSSVLQRYLARFHGPVPEAVREQIAFELCGSRRRVECAALFARWLSEDPGSVDALLEPIPPPLRPPRGLLWKLAAFYEGARPIASGATTVEEAQKATRLYRDFYYHGTPFARASLARAWQECRLPDAESCAAGRAEVEREIGALDGRDAPATAASAALR